MSAVPTSAPPQAKAVSAASLLAGATKKGKTSNHLLYRGEAGREAAERWLHLDLPDQQGEYDHWAKIYRS